MAEPDAAGVVVLSGSWGRAHDEAGFVARTVSAALSRLGPVEVVVPGPAGTRRPDGAFDLLPVGGLAIEPRWPDPAAAEWPTIGPFAVAVIEDGDLDALTLADRFLPGVPTVSITSVANGEGTRLGVGVGTGAGSREVGLHIPVHRLAAARGHVGIGFDDYVLVLGDQGPGEAGDASLTPGAAWLAARFAGRHVLVVENAVATVWRARSLRGVVTVDTRTDLWRLLAHARLTVDLAPGPLVARECVESLHYGVPVVVPAGGAGGRLAAGGGGLWFDDEAELLGCVEALDDQRVRDTLGEQGRALVAEWYGDAPRFVERVSAALAAYGVGHPARQGAGL